MKKHLLNLMGCAALAFGSMTANAQLPTGSIAPDWTFTDLNGNSHNLYSLLDQGFTVYIDVSATWCRPCWNYHTGVTNGTGGVGALHLRWQDHGPIGQPGVSASSTNDVWVFFIEGDGATTLSDLQGLTGASQGEWITGTDYPIINPSSSATTTFNNDYNIGYFPTVYAICPDRTITATGQATVTSQYAARNNCSFSVGFLLSPWRLGEHWAAGCFDELTSLVPSGATYAAVDGDQWGSRQLLPGRRRVPFIEHEGQFWGEPENGEQAVQALRRQRDRGLQVIVFAPSCVWWLQHYPELHDELRGRHRRLHAGGSLEAYRQL